MLISQRWSTIVREGAMPASSDAGKRNEPRSIPPCPAPGQMLLRAGLWAFIAFACFWALPAAAAPQPYLLGPQDEIRLKVYEWRPSLDEIYEWKALSDKFVIGPNGMVSLPFAGQIKAAGLTTDELAKKIRDRLKTRMKLATAPDTSVEIAQFRPFYVVGYVMKSGAFPYQPDLTVLKAVSIAGGFPIKGDSLTRFEREIISGQGDVGVLALNTLNLLARKARLEAELSGADKIDFPKQLTDRSNDSRVAAVMHQERLIFDTRRDGQKTQIQALGDLKEFLTKELSTLKEQLGFRDKQIALIQKELASVSTLVDKGLAVAPRQMALESTLAQLQSERLAAETNLLRARQELSKTDIAVLDLRNKFKNDVTSSLRKTQSDLDEVRKKAGTATQLLRDSEVTAPILAANGRRDRNAKPTYTIIRATNGGTVEIPADEGTLVEPGDTIKVDRPPMPDLDLLDPAMSGAAAHPTSEQPGSDSGPVQSSVSMR